MSDTSLADLIAFTWRGPWDSSASYFANDAVSFDNMLYLALVDSSGVSPRARDSWQIFKYHVPILVSMFGQQGAAGQDGIQGQDGNDGQDGNPGQNGTNGTNGINGVTYTWRGLWSAPSSYSIHDLVRYTTSAYKCILTVPAIAPDHFDTFQRGNNDGWAVASPGSGDVWNPPGPGNGTEIFQSEARLNRTSTSPFVGLDGVINSSSVELLIKWRKDSGSSPSVDFFLFTNYNGTLGSQGIDSKVAFAYLGPVVNGGFLLETYDPFGADLSNPIANFTYNLGVWYWTKFRVDSTVSNTTLSIKSWQDGNTEPGSWLTQWTSPMVFTPGKAGIRGNGDEIRIQYFSISDPNASHPTPNVDTSHWSLMVQGA